MSGLGVLAKGVMLARCVLSLGGKNTAVKQQEGNRRMTDNLYEDLVTRYAKNFVPVVVPTFKIIQIKELVRDIILKKQQEGHHQIDNKHEFKRFFTGLMGEAAVEELLHTNIIEWDVGESADYNHPDIKKLGVGIKTAERNKFPIIPKDNTYPQIICVLSDKRDDVVFICGLATTDVLNRYQSDTLVLSQNLLNRGTKTGFYGFHMLKPVKQNVVN